MALQDKNINQEIDDEVTKLLGANKMYGEDDVSKLSTLKAASSADGDAAGAKSGAAAAKKDTRSMAETVRDVATDAVSAFLSGASGGIMAAQTPAAQAAARAAALSQKFGFTSTGKKAPPKVRGL